MRVRPKPLGKSISTLPLSPEEGFVLSRIDGRLSVDDLEALTGIEASRLAGIVAKLASHGAVDLEEAESSGYLPDVDSSPKLDSAKEKASLADFASALGMDPTAFAGRGTKAAVEAPVAEERAESRSNYPPPAVPGENESDPELPASDVVPVADLAEPESATQLADAQAAGPTEAETEEGAEESADVARNERNYRQLYETKFHSLTPDARVGAAKTSSGSDLLALCFDADPRVITAILENHLVGLDHARMIAMHHHTGTGLEIVTRRRDFLHDSLVERRLLRNPQCGDMVLSRILSNKRVFAVYKIAIDREIPELTRAKSRGQLKKSWQTATPEERSDLVIRTEARCLTYLTGCTFDAKTTQILCGRNYASAMFVQNIAKFPAAPPGLLAHLCKQPFVRKSMPLRRMLLQHPNLPGEVKRSM